MIPLLYHIRNKKASPNGSLGLAFCKLVGVNADLLLILGLLLKLHLAGDESKEGVVFTDTDIVAGMDGGASLTNDNATCGDGLAVSGLYTKTLGLAIAAVLGRTNALFVSEELQADS